MAVRRYRVKFSVTVDGRYAVKTKEFGSLRSAGAFVRDLGRDSEFLEIRGLDIGPLTDPERSVFAYFTDGKVKT